MPEGVNSPAEVIGVIFSPTDRPGSLSMDQSAACSICASLNARRWAIASSMAASTSPDRCLLELVGTHPEPVGRHLDPVEPAERVAHRLVASVADVVDQFTDRPS